VGFGGCGIRGGDHRLVVRIQELQRDADVLQLLVRQAIGDHHPGVKCLALQREFLLYDNLDFGTYRIGGLCKGNADGSCNGKHRANQ